MGIFYWAGEHWFDLVQSLGIVASLLFTATALRDDAKARQTTNLIEITNAHREIWMEALHRPSLLRIFNANVDLKAKPMTAEEELLVGFLILHLNVSYQGMKDGVFIPSEGLRKDIRQFFSLPIPMAVWEKMKGLQNEDFVKFVEACVAEYQKKG